MDLAALGLVDQRADVGVGVDAAAEPQLLHPRGQPPRELVDDAGLRRRSGWPTCTPRPCCAAWPSSPGRRRARGRRRRRPAAPRCRRAPSRRAARRSIARVASARPTSVEPVNDSLRSRGSSNSGSVTSPDRDVVTTFSTPAGSPASAKIVAEREHRQRRLPGRLDDHRAAGGDRRADLARPHREREVPRRDQQARPDRLAHRQQARPAVGADRVAAVDPHGLLAEPAQEVVGVGDLGARLDERLAHLERSSAARARRCARRSARTRAAGSRRARAAASRPTRPARRRPRRARPARRPRRRRRSRRAARPVAGILDRERAPPAAAAPGACDQQLLGDG